MEESSIASVSVEATVEDANRVVELATARVIPRRECNEEEKEKYEIFLQHPVLWSSTNNWLFQTCSGCVSAQSE